jgi:alkanesulfonate monooxygenase SsuD/methylene tetrahydromethanopterin reductase-like flavin-dependent oxidoreductase (luciferase family)
MKFGLHLPNSGVLSPHADLLAMARRAEDIGFDALWVFDHLFNPVDLAPESHFSGGVYHNRPEMPYYDPLTTLAVVAG